jgi:uncharacterized protein with PIN domain
MAIIDVENIAGYHIENRELCAECAGEAAKDATLDEIILRDEIDGNEDRMWFCDECKKQL